MNLILAIVWLLLGVCAFAWEIGTGTPLPGWLRIGNFSVGWLAIPLCLYNLARWWGERTYQQNQQAMHQAQARWQRETHRRGESGGDIDPNFDFTAEPPAPRQTNLTDRPPSPN
jgi:hypothetical protein